MIRECRTKTQKNTVLGTNGRTNAEMNLGDKTTDETRSKAQNVIGVGTKRTKRPIATPLVRATADVSITQHIARS